MKDWFDLLKKLGLYRTIYATLTIFIEDLAEYLYKVYVKRVEKIEKWDK